MTDPPSLPIDQTEAVEAKPPQNAQPQSVLHQTFLQTSWSGSLPPPAALEHFERILPGSAERLFRMVEQEQAHRHELERKTLDGINEQSRLGQGFGAMLALVAILCAIISVFAHAPWEATVAFVGVPMLGIVRAFIHGRDSSTKK